MPSSTPSLTYVFDCDGTIYDSRALHQEAYRLVGVTLTDADFGKPWQEWLLPMFDGDRDLATYTRSKKQDLYEQMIRETPPALLGAGEAATELVARGEEVYFLTSAFGTGATAVLNRYKLGGHRLLAFSAPTALKHAIIKRMNAHGVYVDDNLELGRRVIQDTFFTLQHYQGESKEEVLTWMQ